MTKAQKLILIVLTINAILLGFGLIVLHKLAMEDTPQQGETTFNDCCVRNELTRE